MSVTTSLSNVLIPRGAYDSAADWSLGEALHLFVTDAMERSLFQLEEFPDDAVAVFRAYELGNELSNFTIAGWFGNMRPDEAKVAQTVRGLDVIGAGAIALAVAQVAETLAGGGDPADIRVAPADEGAVIAQCSAWVREWPNALVLGDGKHDEHYKMVMRSLARCNPAYGERLVTLNERRARLGRPPIAPIEGAPSTLENLIEELRDPTA